MVGIFVERGQFLQGKKAENRRGHIDARAARANAEWGTEIPDMLVLMRLCMDAGGKGYFIRRHRHRILAGDAGNDGDNQRKNDQ